MSKLSEKMRNTLETLEEYEGVVEAGATAGEIMAAGGSRSCLYSAVKKDWARPYGKNQGFYNDRNNSAPRYYRTEEGTKALEAAAPGPRVWVLDIDHELSDKGDYIGYVSVHTTEDGAHRRLREIAREWGIEDLLEADELRYSIGHLPIEDD